MASHTSAPLIITDRIILRSARASDFPDCLALWSQPEIYQFIGGTPPSERDVWERLLRYSGMWVLCGYGFWILEDRVTHAYLGEAGIGAFRRNFAKPVPTGPEAGWCISSQAQGKGLATEAMTAILAWADRSLPDEETFCIIDPENFASIRVAKKLGFAPAGQLQLGDDQPLHFRRTRIAPYFAS